MPHPKRAGLRVHLTAKALPGGESGTRPVQTRAAFPSADDPAADARDRARYVNALDRWHLSDTAIMEASDGVLLPLWPLVVTRALAIHFAKRAQYRTPDTAALGC